MTEHDDQHDDQPCRDHGGRDMSEPAQALSDAGFDVREIHNHEPSWWLDQQAHTAVRKAHRCEHLPTETYAIVNGPQSVLFLCSRRIACEECIPTVAAEIGVLSRCDRCKADRPTQWGWIPCGQMVVVFGLCAPCMVRELPDQQIA